MCCRDAVVGIEGKAREGFEERVSAKERNPGRLEGLCKRLGLDPSDAGDLRYQLLHRTVATLLEAERYGTEQAMMLVQSFDESDTSFGDFRVFAERIGLSGAAVSALTSAKPFDGVTLRLGWAKQADDPARKWPNREAFSADS